MKYKKYCKFSICIILILAICLCLSSCSSDIPDENNEPGDVNNQSPNTNGSTSDSTIYEAVPSLEFSTIEEFAGVLFDGKLTEEQKDMINKFPKDKNGQTLTFDLDNLQVPVLPENVSVKSITWTGESYCYFVGFDGGGHGTINYETNRKEVYERHLSKLDDIFKSDHITITNKVSLDDGKGGEKTVIHYTTPVSSLKSIRYSLGDGNKVFVIEKVFCLEVNHSLIEVSDTIPYYIALFCEEGNEYYIIHLSSLTEDPSDEWLLDFGLEKYVEVSDSKE